MSLAINYCKEIAKELNLIAVYRPGTEVKPGDIIEFTRSNIFGVPKALGDFKKIGSLSDFQIDLETETEDGNALDSYVYGSKGSVNASFQADANAGDVGKGKLTVAFSKEGATYLSALDCKETRFTNIITLEDQLLAHKDKIKWNNYFIVISVTVASKALIMQSNTTTASLEILGEVKNLSPVSTVVRDLSASLSVKTDKYHEASFIKDWSQNVPVFFKLVRFRKKFLGGHDLDTNVISMMKANSNVGGTLQEVPYALTEIDPSELVDLE